MKALFAEDSIFLLTSSGLPKQFLLRYPFLLRCPFVYVTNFVVATFWPKRWLTVFVIFVVDQAKFFGDPRTVWRMSHFSDSTFKISLFHFFGHKSFVLHFSFPLCRRRWIKPDLSGLLNLGSFTILLIIRCYEPFNL